MELPTKASIKQRLSLVFVIPMIFLIFLIFLTKNIFFSADTETKNTKVNSVTIKKNNVVNNITAFGLLKSKHQQNIVSNQGGIIVKLNVTTGEQVQKNTVIMQLMNKQVLRSLSLAKHELKLSKSQWLLLQAEMDDRELTLKNNQKVKQGELSIAEIEFKAQQALATKNIISSIDLQRSKLKVKQLRLMLSLQDSSYTLFQTIKKAKLNIKQLIVQEKQDLLNDAKMHVDELNIKANIVGRVQMMTQDFRLGDRVNSGDNIAIIADSNDLYAEIFINASDVTAVKNGMSVALNIKGKSAQGTIINIAPTVKNNQIKLTISITSALPKTALPNIEISAKIQLSEDKNKPKLEYMAKAQ